MKNRFATVWAAVLVGAGSFVATAAGAQSAPSDQPPAPSPSPTSTPGSTYPAAPPSSPAYPPPPALPPNYAQPGTYPPDAPGTAPAPPGYAPIEPLPPPPKRNELSWSFRFNAFDLIFGKLSAEFEHALGDQFSIVVGPEYIFADPRQDSSLGITANGGGVYGEVGFWLDGRPLRGYFLKGHVGYRSVVFHSDIDRLHVPETLLGILFGSQSIYAGWFTLSGGIGIAFDFNAQDRHIDFPDASQPNNRNTALLQATGPLHNGFDLITQLSLGGSF
jgi:hypothetical protein